MHPVNPLQLKQCRVLIAEDIAGIRNQFRYGADRSSTFSPANIILVGDGEEAIEAVRESNAQGTKFDLVILDLDMPRQENKEDAVNGEDALEEIKAIQPDIKAMFHTGSDSDQGDGFSPRREGKNLANKHRVPVIVKRNTTWQGMEAAISLVLLNVFMVFPDS